MRIKHHIPNIITLSNIGCGLLGLLFVLRPGAEGINFTMVGVLMSLGMIFDFGDGLVARLLGVSSPLGKQLDSLADMVTFGVLPGMLVFTMIETGTGRMAMAEMLPDLAAMGNPGTTLPWYYTALPYIGLMIPLFSALRLAKFNVDDRQSDRFHGLPTPGNAFFFLSIFLMFGLDGGHGTPGGWTIYPPLSAVGPGFEIAPPVLGYLYHPFVLSGITVLFSLFLVIDFPLIALKFKNWNLKENLLRYILLGGSGVLLLIFWYRAVPMIILLYFILSVIERFSPMGDAD